MIIEENLDTYFADLGQEVVFNGITKKGLLNMPDEILAGDLMISTDYVLTVQTKQFEDVVLGSILIINVNGKREKYEDKNHFPTCNKKGKRKIKLQKKNKAINFKICCRK